MGKYHIALPYLVFCITYFPVGIIPFRFIFFTKLQVFVRNKPLSEEDRLLYCCPLSHSTAEPLDRVCLGDGEPIAAFTLHGLVRKVLNAYWFTNFAYFSRIFIRLDKERKLTTLEQWQRMTKRQKNLNFILKADWFPLRKLDEYLFLPRLWGFFPPD